MGKCRRVSFLIGAYVSEALSPEEMRQVRAHIEECPRCAHELQETSQAVNMVPRDLPALSDEERMRVVWAVRGAMGERERTRLFARKRFFAAGMAVLGLAVLAVGTLSGMRVRESRLFVRNPSPVKLPAAAVHQPEIQASLQETPAPEPLAQAEPIAEDRAVRPVRQPEQTAAVRPGRRISVERAVNLIGTMSRAGDSVERVPGENKQAEMPDTAPGVPPAADAPDNAELLPEPPQ